MSLELGLNALQLTKNISGITVHCYHVMYDRCDEMTEPTRLIRTVVFNIRRENKYPVTTNLGHEQIISLTPLIELVVDTPQLVATLIPAGQISLNASDPQDNGSLQRLVNLDLEKAAYSLSKEKHDSIEQLQQNNYVYIREKKPSSRIKVQADYLDVFKTIKLDPQVLPTGEVLVGLQLSHALVAKSDISLQWVIDKRPEWLKAIKRVRHRYQAAGKERAVAEFEFIQPELNGLNVLPSIGKNLYDYHSGKGEVRSDLLEQIKHSTLVKVKYGKNLCDHVACLLEPMFDFDSLSEIDPRMLTRLAKDLKWPMGERIRDGYALVSGLHLPTLDCQLKQIAPDVLLIHRFDINQIKLQFARGISNNEKDVLRYSAFAGMTRQMIIPVVVGINPDMNLANRVFQDVFNTLSKINPTELPEISPAFPIHITNAEELDARLEKRCPENAILLIALAAGSDKAAVRDTAFSYKLATQFFRLDHKPSVYAQSSYAGNIAAGVFSKGGGQLCEITNMPGKSDLFVGLDMAGTTVRSPGFSFLFTRDGAQLGWQLADRQVGEKMSDLALAEILEQCFKTYKKALGEPPRHITLHRDGKFYENLDVIRSFECKYGVTVDVLEVLKSGAPAIYRRGEEFDVETKKFRKVFLNPVAGDGFLVTEKEMILATYSGTELGKMDDLMSVRSLRLRKRYGETDLRILAEQVVFLSRIHGASLYRHPRLPVTTHHADRFGTLRNEVRVESLSQMDRLCPVYL